LNLWKSFTVPETIESSGQPMVKIWWS